MATNNLLFRDNSSFRAVIAADGAALPVAGSFESERIIIPFCKAMQLLEMSFKFQNLMDTLIIVIILCDPDPVLEVI